MSLNQSFISDFSEYYRWSQRTKIKYKLHYGWCTGRRFTAATRHNTSCSMTELQRRQSHKNNRYLDTLKSGMQNIYMGNITLYRKKKKKIYIYIYIYIKQQLAAFRKQYILTSKCFSSAWNKIKISFWRQLVLYRSALHLSQTNQNRTFARVTTCEYNVALT